MATTPRTVHGADVSHHQPALDLALAKRRGLQFLYHKVTEGDTFTDPEYAARRKQAAKVGLPFGAYHFARAEYLKRGTDAVAEARRFIKAAAPAVGDLIPALDIETSEGLTPGQIKRWSREFADEVERLIGVRPVLYSPWELGLGLTRWVPRYNDSNTPPTIPWDIWQFSNGQLGKPDTFPGLGHVDLNTFAKGFALDAITIKPKRAPKPEPVYANLDAGHFSLQFSDSPKQIKHDADKIFALGLEVVTGTEAGPAGIVRDIVRKSAAEHGYYITFGQNTFACVRKDLVRKGTLERGYEPVLTSKEGVGRHDGRGIAWIRFESDKYGDRKITVGSGHYLTRGRVKGEPNYELNVRYAKAVGAWAQEHGAGKNIVLYGGDQNIPDTTKDTFMGEPLTSLQDELGVYFGTGHGPIDVIATYDKDGAVVGVSVKRLDDKNFFLHTDHFGVVGRVKVRLPRAA